MKKNGQGIVEYVLILVLMAVVVIVILALLGSALQNVGDQLSKTEFQRVEGFFNECVQTEKFTRQECVELAARWQQGSSSR